MNENSEVTVEITQFCPNECDYCSSNAGPTGKHLDYKSIEKFLLSHSDSIGRINISGGEPVAHPDFYKILMLCYSITKNVWVYTNAITQIIFNSDRIEEIKVEANVCVVAGRDAYIPKDVNKVHLLKLVRQGRAKNLPEQNISASFNFSTGIHDCKSCNHILLQADGKIVRGPCRKEYE